MSADVPYEFCKRLEVPMKDYMDMPRPILFLISAIKYSTQTSVLDEARRYFKEHLDDLVGDKDSFEKLSQCTPGCIQVPPRCVLTITEYWLRRAVKALWDEDKPEEAKDLEYSRQKYVEDILTEEDPRADTETVRLLVRVQMLFHAAINWELPQTADVRKVLCHRTATTQEAELAVTQLGDMAYGVEERQWALESMELAHRAMIDALYWSRQENVREALSTGVSRMINLLNFLRSCGYVRIDGSTQ